MKITVCNGQRNRSNLHFVWLLAKRPSLNGNIHYATICCVDVVPEIYHGTFANKFLNKTQLCNIVLPIKALYLGKLCFLDNTEIKDLANSEIAKLQ